MLKLQTALLAACVAGIIASPVAVARGRTIWGKQYPGVKAPGLIGRTITAMAIRGLVVFF